MPRKPTKPGKPPESREAKQERRYPAWGVVPTNDGKFKWQIKYRGAILRSKESFLIGFLLALIGHPIVSW